MRSSTLWNNKVAFQNWLMQVQHLHLTLAGRQLGRLIWNTQSDRNSQSALDLETPLQLGWFIRTSDNTSVLGFITSHLFPSNKIVFLIHRLSRTVGQVAIGGKLNPYKTKAPANNCRGLINAVIVYGINTNFCVSTRPSTSAWII